MHNPACSLNKPTEVMNGVLTLMDTALKAEQVLLEDALTEDFNPADFAAVNVLWSQVQTSLGQIAVMDAETADDIRLCIVAERLVQYFDGAEDVDPMIWQMTLESCVPENETDALVRRSVDLACRHAELTEYQPCI